MNKKGLDYFSALITIFGIIAITSLIVFLTATYSDLARESMGGVGGRASLIFSAYQEAENQLLTMDYGIRTAAQSAIYQSGQEGFGATACGETDGFAHWSRGVFNECSRDLPPAQTCIPSDLNPLYQEFHAQMISVLGNYNVHAPENTLPEVPMIYPDVTFTDTGEGVTISGTGLKTTTIEKENLKYELESTFNETLPVDVVGSFYEITQRAEQLTENFARVRTGIEQHGDLRWEIVVEDGEVESCTRPVSCVIRTIEVVEDPSCEEDDDSACTDQIPIYGDQRYTFHHKVAKITIKEIDPDYNVGVREGYRGFVNQDGVQVYEYNFALDWINDVESTCS